MASNTTSFPPDFLWGVALGAHQTEGNNTTSDWWYRETQAGTPISDPCGDAVDSYHRWPEDLALAADAGFTDYRFGIEWSRIEPAEGRISLAALAHYRRIVDAIHARGLRPLPTLHHFTVPQWFAASGGWGRPDAVERFVRYVDALVPVLHGVERVQTVNEPNILAMMPALAAGADLSAGLPEPDPGLTTVITAAHQAARDRLREQVPGILVGWGISVQDYRSRPGAEHAAAQYREVRDEQFLRVSAEDDWVGVQTYTGFDITASGLPAFTDGPTTQTGWPIAPRALGGAVRRAASVAGVPVIVTENGIAVADDAERIAFTTEALAALTDAVRDGVDVRGYFHWSLLDNWEWGHWEPRFGLVEVDRRTFQRRPKPSLAWLGAQAPGVASTAGTTPAQSV